MISTTIRGSEVVFCCVESIEWKKGKFRREQHKSDNHILS